jgi:DNA-directed RNA polymerase specialized sigma24 family protein
MIRSGQEEDDFSRLLREVREGAVPLDSILEHSEFQRRGRQICRHVSRNYSDGSYDAEDLFLDTCVRMLAHEEGFMRPNRDIHTNEPERENMPDAETFFRWFFVVALNIFRSRLRKMRSQGRLGGYGLPTISVPIEEAISVRDASIDLEGECFLREFQDFITANLPDDHRCAIALRMEGYSYREIAAALNGNGVKCSHTGIRIWIADGLENFFPRAKSFIKRFS